VTTDAQGNFKTTETFTANQTGRWHLDAEYAGDSTHKASKATRCDFTVFHNT
jgi:hypothetical protein